MNSRSSEAAARECIRDGSRRTGQTFKGVLNYIRRHRPPLVILENVATLELRDEQGSSNADQCASELGSLGCVVPWSYGVKL